MSDVPAEWADEPWDYSTAARSIALNLQEFCDESLPYPEMIADAARKAAAECARLREALRDVVDSFDRWQVDPADREGISDEIDSARAALRAPSTQREE